MFYKKYPPPDKYRSLIECFYIWEGYPTTILEFESPPSGLCSIVFNYKKEYEVSNSTISKQRVPKAFVCGQAIKNYTLHISGEIGMVGIVFRPAAFYHFVGTPMFALTGKRINLANIISNYSNKIKIESLQSYKHKEKIEYLENFLAAIKPDQYFGTPEILYAANQIFMDRGQIELTELIKSTYMSRRNFERKFLTEVGVSPKVYAKIRRFGYTCSLMAGKKTVDLMEVLHKGGYYDQSHFIKDFKYFSGRTPRKYINTNTELANHLSSIQIAESQLHFHEKN